MQILRDSIWQFIGVVVALIALTITTVTIFGQRKRKRIVYEIESYTPLLTGGAEKVELLFNGRKLDNAYLATFKISNNGNIAIRSNDFENGSPIIFDFGQKAEVLTAEVVSTGPKGVKDRVNLEQNEGRVMLKPLLLNSKDTIEIKVLLTGEQVGFEVYGTIYEVAEIKNKESLVEVTSSDSTLLSIALLSLFGLVEVLCLESHLILIQSNRIYIAFNLFNMRIDFYSMFVFIIWSILFLVYIIYIIFSQRILRFLKNTSFFRFLFDSFADHQ